MLAAAGWPYCRAYASRRGSIVVCCMSHAVGCTLHVARPRLHVARCTLHAVCCMSYAACRTIMSYFACRMLRVAVACCMPSGARCVGFATRRRACAIVIRRLRVDRVDPREVHRRRLQQQHLRQDWPRHLRITCAGTMLGRCNVCTRTGEHTAMDIQPNASVSRNFGATTESGRALRSGSRADRGGVGAGKGSRTDTLALTAESENDASSGAPNLPPGAAEAAAVVIADEGSRC